MSVTSTIKIIAGENAGIPVRASADVHQIFENLENLARNTHNYWAQEAVNKIKSLASGHFKPSVFVDEFAEFDKARGFYMLLPGCKAFVMKRANGEYRILNLAPDVNYHLLQKNAKKPALWVTKIDNNSKWSANLHSLAI